MSEERPDLTGAQDELQVLVEQLKDIQKSLRSLRGRLPAPSVDLEAESEQGDVAQELASVIDCVLTDSMGPAIRDLEAASLYRGKRED